MSSLKLVTVVCCHLIIFGYTMHFWVKKKSLKIACIDRFVCLSTSSLFLMECRCSIGAAMVCIFDFKTTWSEFKESSQTAAKQGKAKQGLLDFKSTWSEFQKPSKTAAERGVAELRILDFKTPWSEFQKSSQTAAEQSESELSLLNFKNPWPEF